MAAFVVISTDNRLSGLVDGIEKSLPLNPAVGAHVSTGKIEKKGGDHLYKYRINNEDEDKDENEVADFSELVLNQLAAFRHAYGVSGLLNVFILENPRTEEELQQLNAWLKGIEQLFTAPDAKGDKNIHVCRVLLTYDVEKPNDVARQLAPDLLKSYLEGKDRYAFKDSSSILCIGNKDKDGAAVSFGREEHDFKLPRLLTDFMMLLSSTNNSYNTFNALRSEERCFSLGYAESMYYFPDVREYFKHADKCSLYARLLTSPDETAQIDDDEEAMDIEHHPLGLDERKKRLAGKYADVPFDEDITLHEGSADFVIDACLQKLETLYCQWRDEEIERKREERDSTIAELEDEYDALSQQDWESEEEFNARQKEKFEEKERKTKAQQDGLDKFIDEFPEFISREEIFDHCGGIDDKGEKEEYLTQAGEQYAKLVKYAKGNDFFDYVKEYDESGGDQQDEQPVLPSDNLQDRRGCLFGFGRSKPLPASTPAPVAVTPPPAPVPMLDNVKEIRKQLELKKMFGGFLNKRDEKEQAMKDEEKWCDTFKLTDHSHHYYHLIAPDKLKEYHKEKVDERFQDILKDWDADEENRTLTQLVQLLDENTEDYTERFKYIDWSNPFPFVADTSDTTLAAVCSELYKKSSPFVHYEEITAIAVNKITAALYSDIPDIDRRFNDFKEQVGDGIVIIPYHSTHIASKLCFFQFLPLDKEALDKLCEEQEDSTTVPDEEQPSN